MKKLWKPALLLAAVAIMAYGVISSGAWFTDTATSGNNEIYSGTLILNDAGVTTFDLGTLDNMAPGDLTNEVQIIIKNDGSLPLAWFGDLQVSGSSKLKEAIYVDYAKMEFLAPDGATWTEPTDNFILDGKGSGPYPGWYNGLANASPFKVITLDVFDGANGMGVAPYEFNGALKPGFYYRLTLKFGFAPDAGNDYQGKGPLNLSFNVLATQPKADAIEAINSAWAGVELETWLTKQLGNQVTP